MKQLCKFTWFLFVVACTFTLIVCSSDSFHDEVYAESQMEESDIDQPDNEEDILEPVHKEHPHNDNITIIIGSIMYQDYRQNSTIYCYCRYHTASVEHSVTYQKDIMIMSYHD